MNRGGGRRGGQRGKSPRSAGYYRPVGVQSDNASLGNESGSSHVGLRRSEMTGVGGVTKQFGEISVSDSTCKLNSALRGVGNVTPNVGYGIVVHNVREAQTQSPNLSEVSTKSDSSDSWIQYPGVGIENCSLSYNSWESPDCRTHHTKEPSQIMVPILSDGQSPLEGQRGTSAESDGKLKNSTCRQKSSGFDICPGRSASGVKLKRSLLEKNREKRNEKKSHIEGHNIDILRPGMVLLRGFLSLRDQVKLIKTCHDLGLGLGGFYQPGYSDGAKLHLKMMCLGKNWDPETSMYSDERPIDGAKPPGIPDVFHQLVEGAIEECHTYLESCAKVRHAKDVLPSMSPNICIVNFYAESGKLGLHQDKDESKESLHKGLPVVSFSIGDSADFLYGDERSIDKAEKVVLKSGDVLIFGGESRHIFHGVTTINPGTAPAALLEETNFRPGRLNLTFREY
ncbi:DNA N(6)-methyladenine demethylase ALKBH1D-like [Henckelia pumila]|uniref:DNA N(6)-methyladenine demethylase ALKBH1D-like n=1 Tax=Henckelia pumila TaxID=405737 RepID=UPI003C6DE83C